MTERTSTRRLFFALWPDQPVRDAIDGAAVEAMERGALAGIGGRRVPRHNLHLTLVFLGDVPKDGVSTLSAGADEVRATAFDLRLDRFGTFPRARVAWLGAAPVGAGEALVAALQEMAAAAGLSVDRRPWRPHVTLKRRIDGRAKAALAPGPDPIDWPVRDFALIESIPGRPYQVLRTWPLE